MSIQETSGKYPTIILRSGGASELGLEDTIGIISEISERVGLKPCPTYFDMVPATKMYEYGSYGLPGRFSHWTYGRDYQRQKTMYDHGFSKIYELVVNNNPAYAYLLETNTPTANKLVVAHVVGHVDFFQNSKIFGGTNRRMVETVQQNAARFAEYEELYGIDAVEAVIDASLSLSHNFDTHSKHFDRGSRDSYIAESIKRSKESLKGSAPSSDYDDIFNMGMPEKQDVKERPRAKVPYELDSDLLWAIAQFSPILNDWQRDILMTVRSEQQYFYPQMLTKIMNEGWASLWHSRIMRELHERRYLSDGEMIDFSKLHSGVISGNGRSLNPYGLGLALWEDIDDKFHGRVKWGEEKEFDRYGDEVDPQSYVGRQDHDIFFVRENMVDQGFLRSYLTGRMVRKLDLFSYKKIGDMLVVVDKDPVSVRDKLVASMDRFGLPSIVIPEDGANYTSTRELYIEHEYEGKELDLEQAKQTLERIYFLWGRPVHLETVLAGEKKTLDCESGPTVLTV